jgi:hypothetical protein
MHAYFGVEEDFNEFRLVPYSMPASTIQLKAQGLSFGQSGIRLEGSGFELVRRSQEVWINVWLRWETSRAVSTSYTVFVHLLDEKDQLVAQHDSLPQANYAPTTSWPPGVVIDDRHSVLVLPSLPAGIYQLSVGLYDSQTGQRLPLSGQPGDAADIGSVELK